ncbi:tpr repeat-containing protein [Anaeramoeba flamelloides]|uniref:Tpr repeat-containing protein n=1 Tax=Anaeramoeba flamelloides TaxID=1746091 RepID=A0ABQ8YEH6_9EUKA|nr:tpr repeat-containing protein [Anaeramoeba flamelloides]
MSQDLKRGREHELHRHFHKAQHFYSLKNFDESLKFVKKAIQASPIGNINLGIMKLHKGLVEVQQLTEKKHTVEELHNKLQTPKNSFLETISFCQQLLDTHWIALYHYSRCVLEDSLSTNEERFQALKDLRRSLELSQGNPEILFEYARFIRKYKQPSVALQIFQSILNEDENEKKFNLNDEDKLQLLDYCALCSFDLYQYDHAFQFWEEAIQINESSWPIVSKYAIALGKCSKFEKCLRLLDGKNFQGMKNVKLDIFSGMFRAGLWESCISQLRDFTPPSEYEGYCDQMKTVCLLFKNELSEAESIIHEQEDIDESSHWQIIRAMLILEQQRWDVEVAKGIEGGNFEEIQFKHDPKLKSFGQIGIEKLLNAYILIQQQKWGNAIKAINQYISLCEKGWEVLGFYLMMRCKQKLSKEIEEQNKEQSLQLKLEAERNSNRIIRLKREFKLIVIKLKTSKKSTSDGSKSSKRKKKKGKKKKKRRKKK